ncbi:MAG: diaminopimelate decarboxylase [Proteobacteria bacterium]|nr:diaminopimelate decarboxylase [Pseudomonadota bacterium]
MNDFIYHNHELTVDGLSVKDIVRQCQTPCFIYSHAGITRAWRSFDNATTHPHLICYAVKANSNLAVLNTLAELGSGFDIVSQGELMRVLAAKGDPRKVVFSGVGKQSDEIAMALKVGINCFNVESEAELLLINQIANHLNVQAPIALRVNPDVDPISHPYISTGQKESKFGIDAQEAINLYQQAATLKHVKIKGIACHIGSQLTTTAPFVEALQRLLGLIDQLENKGIKLEHVDVGGGLGVHYHHQKPPTPNEYMSALLKLNIPSHLKLILEPGRAIVANAGILATKVLLIKQSGNKHFCVVDCAMNDYLRPTLYDAWHNIIPVQQQPQALTQIYDIVGPICESGDFLGKSRELAVKAGDYLAVCQTGAYGFVMSSNYNSRPKAAEVMAKDNAFKIVRPRETLEEMFAKESLWT